MDTLASHSTDTAQSTIEDNERTYTQTSSYDVTKSTIFFALRNTGACSSVVSVKVNWKAKYQQINFSDLLQCLSRACRQFPSLAEHCLFPGSPWRRQCPRPLHCRCIARNHRDRTSASHPFSALCACIVGTNSNLQSGWLLASARLKWMRLWSGLYPIAEDRTLHRFNLLNKKQK